MTRATLPEKGQPRSEVMATLRSMKSGDVDWKSGLTPLYIFDAGDEVYQVGREAFFEYFKENALGKSRARGLPRLCSLNAHAPP